MCGATGSGKTSLLNLAARLYDPTQGRVLVGGTDLRDLRLEDVRSAMSIVTQRPILFSISAARQPHDRTPGRRLG